MTNHNRGKTYTIYYPAPMPERAYSHRNKIQMVVDGGQRCCPSFPRNKTFDIHIEVRQEGENINISILESLPLKTHSPAGEAVRQDAKQ